MLTTNNGFAARLIGIAVNNFRKIIKSIQGKRNNKQRTELQTALLSGSIRRIK